MDAVEEGVVGIITNHRWLDNPTFKGMRKSLMNTFDQIYFLDLHGNARSRERSPEGGRDENVFDIEQGVAISLLIRRPNSDKGVWRGDLWGTRVQKYEFAAETKKASVDWVQLNRGVPDWLFKSQDTVLGNYYEQLWSIPNILFHQAVIRLRAW
jgi:predicted helicase